MKHAMARRSAPGFWLAFTAALMASSGAHSSFVERCVFYGEVLQIASPEKEKLSLTLRVTDAIPLTGSHTNCARSEPISATLAGTAGDYKKGELVLLQYEREDGLCRSGTVCAHSRWQRLITAEDAL